MSVNAVAATALLLALLTPAFLGGRASAAWAPACKLYHQAALDQPHSSPMLSSIAVGDAFDVGSLGIDNFSLTHPRVGALKITLTAADANIGGNANDILKDTITLKDVNEGGEATGLEGVTFDDNIMVPFPDAPNNLPNTAISGSFFPSQDLQTIALGNGTTASTGGSNGTWTLRIVDLGQNSTQHLINLKSWTLVLCPAVPPVIAEQGASPAPAAPAAAAAAVPSNAVTTAAEVKAANSGETGKLLMTLLDRVTRAAPNSTLTTRLNGTPRAWSALANSSSSATTSASEGLFGNDTITQRISNRLDQLLGVDAGAAASNASGAALMDGGASGASVLGGFVLGNSTLLPQEPTSKLLQALRALINDVGNASDATANSSAATGGNSSSFRSAAPPQVTAQSGPLGSGGLLDKLGSIGTLGSSADGSSIFTAFSQLLTGNKYLDTIASTLSGLQDTIQNIPAVKLVQGAASKATDRVTGAQSTVAQSLRSAQDYASSQVQDRVNFLQGQTDMVQAAIKNRISNYEQALTGVGSIISQAINKHSNTLLAHSKDIQSVTRAVRDQVSQQTSSTAQTVLQNLDTIIKSTSGMGTVAKGLQGDFNAALHQLLDVYKAHLESAASILSASTNAALSQAQFRAEGAIDQLNTVLGKANGVLDKLANGAQPVVGNTLDAYQQGLQFVEAALQGIKSKIVTAPDVNYGQLVSGLGQGGALSGALSGQLQQLTSSLGIGAPSGKVLALLGNIDGFSSKLGQLFPAAAAATSG